MYLKVVSELVVKLNYFENGKCLIEYSDGSQAWYTNAQLHRTDGPAIKWADGNKEWWVKGKRIDINKLLVKITNPNYQPTKFETTILEHLIQNE